MSKNYRGTSHPTGDFKITDTIYGTFIQKLGQAIVDVASEGGG